MIRSRGMDADRGRRRRNQAAQDHILHIELGIHQLGDGAVLGAGVQRQEIRVQKLDFLSVILDDMDQLAAARLHRHEIFEQGNEFLILLIHDVFLDRILRRFPQLLPIALQPERHEPLEVEARILRKEAFQLGGHSGLPLPAAARLSSSERLRLLDLPLLPGQDQPAALLYSSDLFIAGIMKLLADDRADEHRLVTLDDVARQPGCGLRIDKPSVLGERESGQPGRADQPAAGRSRRPVPQSLRIFRQAGACPVQLAAQGLAAVFFLRDEIHYKQLHARSTPFLPFSICRAWSDIRREGGQKAWNKHFPKEEKGGSADIFYS
ncbi:hypothetical protein BN871_JD_00030 [Paenibacillus sp. P22]|nr:hypothetical protein BN871_JD_00030 [Paenibacillus sp. P22]